MYAQYINCTVHVCVEGCGPAAVIYQGYYYCATRGT